MNVGDLVQYREWQPGDPAPDTIPEANRRWGKTGVVVEVGDWEEEGTSYPYEGVTIITEKGYVECRRQDLQTIR